MLLCWQVLQRVLAELDTKYNIHEGKPVVGVVRLTGLAHTEDVVAFREIARQLCKYAAVWMLCNLEQQMCTTLRCIARLSICCSLRGGQL